MPEQPEPFSPHTVDEALDRLSAGPATLASITPSARLARDLQLLYRLEREQYLRALQRAQDRLLARQLPLDEQSTAPLHLGVLVTRQPGGSQGDLMSPSYPTHQPQQTRTRRRFSLLVALLITCLLIGSMEVLGNIIRHGGSSATLPVSATPTRKAAVPTATTTSQVRIVNSIMADANFSGQLAWSPDSQRVAALNLESVQIWDATTGRNEVTIPDQERPPGNSLMAWSPNGKWLAIVDRDTITIADASTGTVVHRFAASSVALVQPTTQGPYLSDLLPKSCGCGTPTSGLVWSPDSTKLAISTSAVANIATSHFVIIDAQNGATLHTLSVPANDSVRVASWSLDGRYLAASVLVVNPSAQIGTPRETVYAMAWDLKTSQLAFKESIGGPSSMAQNIVWQPSTDHLAFSARNGKVIQIWDVVSQRQITQFNQQNTGLLAWSPDGKKLATTVITSRIVNEKAVWNQKILTFDITTNQSSILADFPNSANIDVIAWSPNGKYLATGPNGGGSIMILPTE